MSKYKIAFIVPYFGKFNNYFQLWLESCKYNSDIDWFIYTDDNGKYAFPRNVHVQYITFEQIKNKIQTLFDFPIVLDNPYKLCDYKPIYGELFQNDIKDFDFWGHCDTDLIWGNIRNFVSDDILNKYDKLFSHGHMVLYRNTKKINSLYRSLPPLNGYDYKVVYSTSDNLGFDEFGGKQSWGGIEKMIEISNIPYYKTRCFDDIYSKYYNFFSLREEPSLFLSQDEYIKKRVPHMFLMRENLCERWYTREDYMSLNQCMFIFKKEKCATMLETNALILL